MDKEILVLSIMQFAIQLGVYLFIAKWIYLLFKYIKKEFNNATAVYYAYSVTLFVINIIISFFVRIFTSAGYKSGISNLFASFVLAFIMSFWVLALKLNNK